MARGKHKKFYASKQWRELREMVMNRDHRLCYLCSEPACIVHHIKWITPHNVDDMKVTLNPDNLLCLCLDCHNKVHLNINEEEFEQKFDSLGNLLKPKEIKKRINEKDLNLLRQQVNPKDYHN